MWMKFLFLQCSRLYHWAKTEPKYNENQWESAALEGAKRKSYWPLWIRFFKICFKFLEQIAELLIINIWLIKNVINKTQICKIIFSWNHQSGLDWKLLILILSFYTLYTANYKYKIWKVLFLNGKFCAFLLGKNCVVIQLKLRWNNMFCGFAVSTCFKSFSKANCLILMKIQMVFPQPESTFPQAAPLKPL